MKVVLTGGFLGSGKTTAIVSACQQLLKQGKKVGVVTNDQGDQQVDSAFVKHFGIPTREVSKGCFCCHYDQLDAQLQSLIESEQPDVVFAESVGSCTDLIATIVKPFHTLKPEFDVVVCVFADADLLCALIEGRSSFLEESVRYIYKKQLEEADIVVINKTDLVSSEQLRIVKDVVQSDYRDKITVYQNSLNENDILTWLDIVQQFQAQRKRSSLTIDYDVYGEGEAKLAWLDKSISIRAPRDNGILAAHKIIGDVFDQIQKQHLTIGHLKFFLEAGDWREKISFTTTSTSAAIQAAPMEAREVSVLINARVQTDPSVLTTLVDDACARAENLYGCAVVAEKWSAFQPGYPRPTHRVVD